MPNNPNNPSDPDNLPADIFTDICSFLSPEDLKTAAPSNKSFNVAIHDNLLWQNKFKDSFPYIFETIALEDNFDWYAEFHKACHDKYKIYAVVNDLLAKKADINHPRLNGATPLFIAAQQGYLHVVNALLANNAHVDAGHEDGATPLFVASQQGHLCLVNVLLAKNANINSAARYRNGATPLFIASQKGQEDVVTTLLANNANINAACTDGATPLFVASYRGYPHVVNALLEKNADIEAPFTNGATPLFIASQKGHGEIVNALLANNANINAACMDGATPLSIAKEKNHADIVLAIKKHRLINYLEKTNARPDDDYHTHTLFDYTFNLSFWGACSAKQKKDAASALKSVIFDGADRSCLNDHQKALNNGELKSIDRSLNVR